MHAVILGASKGCGYHALLRLLDKPDWEATILLRKPASIESDAQLKKHLAEGRLTIVKGDATSYEDVKSLSVKKVDVVISTIGMSRYDLS
jgi:NAD(P)-dependent dehydrogenase (short-subunit alcohol dehydrogenase family)